MNTNLILGSLLTLYGALSVIAGLAEVNESGFQPRIMLFILCGACLIGGAWWHHEPARFGLIVVGLLGLHAAAIWQGLAMDGLTPSHHVVRATVTIVLLALYFRLPDRVFS